MSGCPFHAAASGAGYSPAPARSPLASAVQAIAEDDLQCPVCLRLLFEPTTLPCGHTFCASCLRCCALSTEGVLRSCPLCRAPQLDDISSNLSANVLLAALIEKYLPEASAARRLEAAADMEEERRRFTMVRQVSLQLQLLEHGKACVRVEMVGASRCPMHAGSPVPVGFYVSRAHAFFPPGWGPEETTADGAHANFLTLASSAPDGVISSCGAVSVGAPVCLIGLQSAPELNGRRGTCGQQDSESGRWRVYLPDGQAKSVRPENVVPAEGDHCVDVLLHFQPRFQIPPARTSLTLADGERTLLDVEIDSRMVHHG